MTDDQFRQLREQQRYLKRKYGRLLDDITAILFRHDPMGINFKTNTDEYEPEAQTILARLKEANSVLDVRRIVHEEFVRWFASRPGPEERYEHIAQEVWAFWTGYLEGRDPEP